MSGLLGLSRRHGRFAPLVAVSLAVAGVVGVAGASASCGNGDDAASGTSGTSGGKDGGGSVAPTPPSGSASIGASGGTVASSDGTNVLVPAGALASVEIITVTPDPTAPLGSGFVAVGTPYIFGPEGLTFASPATVTLLMTPSLIPAGRSASDVQIYTAPVGSTAFTTLPTMLRDATHVTAPTMHFSIFVPGVPVAPSAGADGGSGASDGGTGSDAGPILLPDGGVDDALTPNETPGSRLHAMYKRTDFGDGAHVLTRMGMYDVQRQEPCDALQMSDGKFYCAPTISPSSFYASGQFADAACTVPIMVYAGPPSAACNDIAPPAASRYMVTQDTVTCGASNHLFQAAASSRVRTGTVYELAGTTCGPASFDATQTEGYPKSAFAEVPLTDFVALTVTSPTVTAGPGRLHAANTVYSGADGSQWSVDGPLVDTQTGSFCTPSQMWDGHQHCVAQSLFCEWYGDHPYTDSSCKSTGYDILPWTTACLSSDPRNSTTLATTGGGYDANFCFSIDMVDVSANPQVTQVYSKLDGPCAAAPIATGDRICSGPAPVSVPNTSFVTVTQAAKDTPDYGANGTRIHPGNVHQVGDDGSDVTPLLTVPVDTQSGQACTPMMLTDGAIHCVPPSLSFASDTSPSKPAYLDAACTQAVVLVYAPIPTCAPALASLVYTEGIVNGCGTGTVYRTSAAPVANPTTLYTKNGAACISETYSALGWLWNASDMVKIDPSDLVRESLSIETR